MKRVASPTTNFALIIHNVCGLVFLAIGIVLGLNQFFKTPISCIGREEISSEFANAVCYGETYIYPDKVEKRGPETPYPGIDKHSPSAGKKQFQHNYRWVPYVFILQSFWFLIAYLIWNHAVTRNSLDNLTYFKDVKTAEKRLQKTLGKNWLFAIKYILLNLMLVIHLSIQIAYLDSFVDGKLKSFVDAEFDEELIRINFPKVTKCDIRRYGSSGDVQLYSFMCVLSMSDVFVKAIRFDYYFLYVSRIVAIISLIYYFCLSLPFLPTLFAYLMPSCRSKAFFALAKKCSIGDWMVVTMVLKAIGVHTFAEIVEISDEQNRNEHEDMEMQHNNKHPTNVE